MNMPDGIRPINKKPWEPRGDRQEKLESATRLAKLVVKARGLHPAHRRHVLSIAIWKATEADSKMNPRFRSRGVMKGAVGILVNHEHVVTRKFLIDAMLAAPGQVQEIMDLAIGCLVTRDEHRRLSKAGGWGWSRYINGNVAVVDGVTGSLVDLTSEDKRLRNLARKASIDVG